MAASTDTLDYGLTRAFFDGRAARAGELHPLSVTMYQDSRPDLVAARDRAEVDAIVPLLPSGPEVAVLDVGCGAGRWGRHLAGAVGTYLGIDFSAGLVALAAEAVRPLYPPGAAATQVLAATELAAERLVHPPPFDLVIVAGLFVYLNDDDVDQVVARIATLLAPGATVYVREPVSFGDRLVLRDHWSEELRSAYHAVYRPAAEYRHVLAHRLGGTFVRDGELAPELRNRAETGQHAFVLRHPAGTTP